MILAALLPTELDALAPHLERHGVALRHEVLADPGLHLIDTRVKPADSLAAARLHRVLDELQTRLGRPAGAH